MRKDVILGMTLGGLMLAIVIGYLVISPNSKQDKHPLETALAEGSTGEGAGTESTEPDAKTGTGYPEASNPELAPYKPTRLMVTQSEREDDVWGGRLFPKTSTTPGLIGAEPATGDVGSGGSPGSDTARGGATTGGTNTPTTEQSTPREGGDVGEIHSTSSHGMHIHKVQQGETFTTIAKAVYGNGNLFNVIVRANPKIDPTRLKIGTEINLPDVSEVKGMEKVAEKDAEKGANAGIVVHKVDMVKIDPKTEYRVQAGDSLHKISVKLFGNISMVDKLYEMNKSVIGSDPAKLKLGAVLKLPAAVVAAN
jgi:nucleoid-associated protein YgaU